jgi:hypothetical protein
MGQNQSLERRVLLKQQTTTVPRGEIRELKRQTPDFPSNTPHRDHISKPEAARA